MNTSARQLLFSWFSFWVIVAVLCLYFLFPLSETLRFGIDLKGGTYITLAVQTDKAVEAELIEKMQRISDVLKKIGKKQPTTKIIEKEAIVLTFSDAATAQDTALLLKTEEPDLSQAIQDATIRLRFADRRVERIKTEAVRSDIEVLRSRLDRLGVAEITIAAQGEKNIIVELPDVADPQQAKAMIGKAAKLEFKLVEREGSTPEDILYELEGELPADKEILPGKIDKGYYLVSKYTDLTGRQLRDARAGIGGEITTVPLVSIQFNNEGADKFYALTSKHYGKRLAIVLDGVVINAPQIIKPISGGSAEISPMRSLPEAKELALFLKSGAFVAPVTFEEDRQIGPGLGAESIRRGLISCLVGLGLLLLFGFFYYNISGLFAFTALIYNLILILFGLSRLQATLTLPGIAGMVLTVGMAIDASILIFERIKEGLAAGMTVKKAVNAGFSDAMVVILDANITTFIVAVVLYKFGTGPIQGFAVTMMLGIISTLITGLFFLRSLFNFVLDAFNVQRLKI